MTYICDYMRHVCSALWRSKKQSRGLMQSIVSGASQTFPVHLVGPIVCTVYTLCTFALLGHGAHAASMCSHAGSNPDLFPPPYVPLCQPVLIYLTLNILHARLYCANRGWSMQVSLARVCNSTILQMVQWTEPSVLLYGFIYVSQGPD